MAYAKIPNLYKDQTILLFREVYCLEKIHGSSSHLTWNGEKLSFFSGGEKHESFVSIFNQELLIQKFKEIGQIDIIIFGEVYSGKCQGMKETYGEKLKFIAFEVKIGDSWLSVPQAEEIVLKLGLEFVYYVKTTTDLVELDKQRDSDSVQAVRNGMGTGKLREGIVIRPLVELTKNNGERIICKYKCDTFSETKTTRKIIDPNQLEILKNAEKIADEYVVPMRLEHILGKLQNYGIENTGEIIQKMIEDIRIEASGEIVLTKDAEKAIGRKTAIMFKNKLKENLK